MIELDRVGWENGTLVSPAKVNVQGTVYDVTPEVYSGNTPLTAELLQEMEDNTENAINRGMTEATLNANTYLTTETRVGTWIDGRPVYEITITATKVSGTDYQYALANSDVIDNAWVVEGYLKSTSGTSYTLNRTEHSGDYIYTRSEIEGRYFKYKSSAGDYTNGQFMARIRYTKTTN